MESNIERGSQCGIPRLSRLPLPRAALSGLHDVRQDKSQNKSQLPRPSSNRSDRLRNNTQIRDVGKHSTAPQHEQGNWQVRNKSPVMGPVGRELSGHFSNAPPDKEDAIVSDENSTKNGLGSHRGKRKPRPSLSERTLETLSQIPPSPSPSRRRSSMLGSHGSMAPPSRPASSLGVSRFSLAARGRSLSPLKLPSTQLEQVDSSASVALPMLSSEEYCVHTPTRGSSKVSSTALAKPRYGSVRANIDATENKKTHNSIPSPRLRTSNAKSIQDLRSYVSRNAASSLLNATRPKDASGLAPSSNGDVVKTTSAQNTKKPIRHRQPTDRDPTAFTLADHMSKSTVATQSTSENHREAQSAQDETGTKIPKSSLALRETIAKAKAAKRAIHNPATKPLLITNIDTRPAHTNSASDEPLSQCMPKTLQRRIDDAVTSGVLNIAAMGLKTLPGAIQKMYDFDPSSRHNWAEAVDLIKFNAADNEFEELPNNFFPDWSTEELQDDDEKSNQFGGLQSLDLRGNNLSVMPIGLRRLEQLRILCLNNNKLTSEVLDIVCQIPHLQELHLANNGLQGVLPLSIASLTELSVLDLHSNRITTLPDNIDNLQKVQKLDLSDNKLEQIPVLKLRSMPLTELNLSKNALTGTLFSEHYTCPRLQILNLSSNKLLAICAHGLDLPRMQTMICDNNQLTALPSMSQMKSLSILSASGNKVESLPDGFTEADNLRSVDLSANHLKVLDLRVGGMEMLTNLNVAANPLRDRKYLAMSTDHLKADLRKRLLVDEVSSAKGIVPKSHTESSVLCPQNASTSSGRFKPSNGVLDLSSKNLAFVDAATIDLTQSVHTIQLANNNLTTLPLDLLTHPMVKLSLKVLDISCNLSLHPTAYLTGNLSLPGLKTLSLASTGLTSLKALMENLSVPALKELNCSCNRMKESVPVVRASFPSVTTLLASDNQFSSIDIEAVRGLEVLDVRNNEIDSVPPQIGELGNTESKKAEPGRLRTFVCSGNRFRVPRLLILEKGTEAILKDLRRMVPADQVGNEWR